MGRTWTSDDRENQSKLILEREPWLLSTGAISIEGKAKIRRNSMKYGYFNESHREFRKFKRSTKARKIEKLIRDIIKTKDDDLRLKLIDQVRQKLSDYCNGMNPSDFPSQKVIEGTYLNSLVLTAVSKCIYKRVHEIIKDSQKSKIA